MKRRKNRIFLIVALAAISAKDNVLPDEAHISRYRNSEVGGMFGIPEVLEINGLKIYFTQGGGEYHYYYSKNNLVIWIAVNNLDRTYRSGLIDEAVRSIGG